VKGASFPASAAAPAFEPVRAPPPPLLLSPPSSFSSVPSPASFASPSPAAARARALAPHGVSASGRMAGPGLGSSSVAMQRILDLPRDIRARALDVVQCQLGDSPGGGTDTLIDMLQKCFKASGSVMACASYAPPVSTTTAGGGGGGSGTDTSRVVLCTSVVSHFSQRGTVDDGDGWACGYRNLQMLVSACVHTDVVFEGGYGTRLFGGCGFIPQLPFLQSWLELAWQQGSSLCSACDRRICLRLFVSCRLPNVMRNRTCGFVGFIDTGFDREGCEHFGGQVVGSRKWIGATEVAALLRSFGECRCIRSFTTCARMPVIPHHGSRLVTKPLRRCVDIHP
jgi:hypothetical protein